LLGDDAAVQVFVSSASTEEVLALFQNPRIAGDFLADLYAKEGVFGTIDESRWPQLINASVGNLRLQTAYSGPMTDGWAEHDYDRVFDNAWRLAGRVPTTDRWAHTLSSLLEDTNDRGFWSVEDKMAWISRWRIDGTSGPENSLMEFGYLGTFGSLRRLLTRPMSESQLRELAAHEDVALRCAFYKYGNLTSDEMKKAFEREPKFFLNNAIENDAIWREAGTRKVLRDLCWAAYRFDYLEPPEEYGRREEDLQKNHPEWFREESPPSQEETTSLAEVANLAKRIDDVQDGLRQRLEALATRLTVVLCILVMLVILALLKRG
jgi:hypothetical protein